MVQHYDPPPDPIPDGWDIAREAILFHIQSSVTADEFRALADDLPAAFNTQSVYLLRKSESHTLIGYARDHTDYNETHPDNPLNANVDPTHGVWNGMWNGLQGLGYDIHTWYKMERYKTGAFIDPEDVPGIPDHLEPIRPEETYLEELDPPPSQE